MLHVCLGIRYMQVLQGQKKVSDLLELESEMVACCPVGAGDQTQHEPSARTTVQLSSGPAI